MTTLTLEELVTNTAAKKENEEGSWVESTQQPPMAKVEIPELPKETKSVEVAKAEAPKGTLHRLRLIEGDKERVVEYWLNDNGEVIQNDVVRSEIPPAPPRPPQTSVRPPAAAPAQAPRPDDEE